MQPYLVLVVLAGIVAMDTTSGPQILISEPVVSCSVLGLLFGRPETGLLIGTIFQLLWFGSLPLGAVRLTDSNMAALICTASLFSAAEIFDFTVKTLQTAIIPALLFGLVCGMVGLQLTTGLRRINGRRSERMVFRLERGDILSISRWHFVGVVSSFLRGALMAVVLVPIGTIVCGLTSFIPGSIVNGISYAVPMIWGIVCASAVFVYWSRGIKKPLCVGFAGGFLWILMVTY
jgi:PTS system mannose-specific IIC component